MLRSLLSPSPEKTPLHTLSGYHSTSHAAIQQSDQSPYSMENALRQVFICLQYPTEINVYVHVRYVTLLSVNQ